MTTDTACAEKAKLQAMIFASRFEKIFALDESEEEEEEEEVEEEVLADTFVIAKLTANSQLSPIICEETESCNNLNPVSTRCCCQENCLFFLFEAKIHYC